MPLSGPSLLPSTTTHARTRHSNSLILCARAHPPNPPSLYGTHKHHFLSLFRRRSPNLLTKERFEREERGRERKREREKERERLTLVVVTAKVDQRWQGCAHLGRRKKNIYCTLYTIAQFCKLGIIKERKMNKNASFSDLLASPFLTEFSLSRF